jgi:hypothetical protein
MMPDVGMMSLSIAGGFSTRFLLFGLLIFKGWIWCRLDSDGNWHFKLNGEK